MYRNKKRDIVFLFIFILLIYLVPYFNEMDTNSQLTRNEITKDVSSLDKLNLYMNNKNNLSSTEAYNMARNLCDENNSKGCFFLGYFFNIGIGTSVNKMMSLEKYKKACILGEDKACVNLAILYQDKNDYKLALIYYRKAHDYKNYIATTSIASYYAVGQGIDKNINKAYEYYKIACDDGRIPQVCSAVGIFHFKKKQYKDAFSYSKQACNMGLNKQLQTSQKYIGEACNNVGFLYYKGYGTEQSFQEAKRYLEKARQFGIQKI